MKLSKLDAWVRARLKSALPVDGEVAGVSAAILPLVEEMATLSWEARQPVFRGFLLALPDPEAFIRSVGDMDLLGPAPDREDRVDDDAPDRAVRLTCLADI